MKRILYLDDDRDLTFLMTELFQDCGAAKVVTVNTFEEFKKLESDLKSFDIIFLDVNLGPNVPNGIDAFDWLIDHKFNKKIIFFTGHANSYPLVQKAATNNNVFVLEKPAAIDQIDKIINN